MLRRESIAQLTRAQLDHVAGAELDGCSLQPASCMHSNLDELSCVVR